MLQNPDHRWHALGSNKLQSAVSCLVYGFAVLKGVLLDASNIRLFATHNNKDQIANFSDIEHRVRVISVHFQKYQSLLFAGHV